MAECECPFCDDFSGSVDSVEGHISSRTDGDHEGELGRYHREELLESVEDDLNGEESAETHSESVDEGVPPGYAMLAATAVFLLVVLATGFGSGGSTVDGGPSTEDSDEEIEDDQGDVQLLE